MPEAIQPTVKPKDTGQSEFQSIKDAFTIYEAGKKRRYELLFAVNGGAFAIAKLLTGSENTAQVLGHLTLAHLAIGMILFTALMCFDIFTFGENMRDRYLRGEVFGRPGQIVLVSLGILISSGWLLAAFDFSTGFSKQSTALSFAIGFLGISRLLPQPFAFR